MIFEKIYRKTELSVKNNLTALKTATENENAALNDMKHFRVGSSNYNLLQQQAMSWANKRIKAEAIALANEKQKNAKILADKNKEIDLHNLHEYKKRKK